MTLSNYTELQAEVANFLNRDDLTAAIPSFIRLAEAKMNRDLRHWRMEKRSTANLDTQFTALPVDFIAPIRLHLNTAATKVLELAGTNEISKLRADASNTTGEPSFYALIDGAIEAFPTPAGAFDLEILYYGTLDALNDSNPTNWVLSNYPDVYLYGTLLHSAPYLMENENIQVWGAYYSSSVESVNQENELAKNGGSGRRMHIRSY